MSYGNSITVRGETEVELEVEFGSCTCECGCDVEYEVDQSHSSGDVDMTIEKHICKEMIDHDNVADILLEMKPEDAEIAVTAGLRDEQKLRLGREWNRKEVDRVVLTLEACKESIDGTLRALGIIKSEPSL